MNEPLPEVLRFCAWYMHLGAAEVVICFDDPADPAIAVLQDQPGVRAVPCTAAFWADLGHRPDDSFVTRQNAALSWIYRDLTEGWLLNVDADEFVYLEAGRVADFLAKVPSTAVSARIVTAERLLAEAPRGEVLFRRPMGYEERKAVYGADAALFGPRRAGLVGHPQGKSFVRCGVPGLSLRQHWPRWGRGEEPREAIYDHREGAHLLHMIGADYAIWRGKLDWRCRSRGFTSGLTTQIEAALALAPPQRDQTLQDLFRRLHGADAERLARLAAVDALLRLDWDPDPLVAARFGV